MTHETPVFENSGASIFDALALIIPVITPTSKYLYAILDSLNVTIANESALSSPAPVVHAELTLLDDHKELKVF